MTLLDQGLIITATGMSVVFLFLGMLVCVTRILSGVMNRFFPDRETDPFEDSDPSQDDDSNGSAEPWLSNQETIEAELAAALALALNLGGCQHINVSAREVK